MSFSWPGILINGLLVMVSIANGVELKPVFGPELISDASHEYSHELRLNAVILNNSGWQLDEILPRLRSTADIFAKCGVRISLQVKLVELPGQLLDVESSYGAGVASAEQMANDLLKVERPALVYIRNSPPHPTGAFSFLSAFRPPSPLFDMAFLSVKTKSPDFLAEYPVTLNIEAHELAHILFESEHIEGQNLLGGKKKNVNDQVTLEQCERLREHPLIIPLRRMGVNEKKVFQYASSHVLGFDLLSPAEKRPIVYALSKVFFRLENWKKFSSFYVDYYRQSDHLKKYPYFVEESDPLLFVILKDGQKVTDLKPYQNLKGKTIEEVFGYGGDTRLFENVGAEGTHRTLVIEKKSVKSSLYGAYQSFYHELGHFVHLTLLTKEEFEKVEFYFEKAKSERRLIGNYSSHNASEYFARAVEAYLSKTKSSFEKRGYSMDILAQYDPDLLELISYIFTNGNGK